MKLERTVSTKFINYITSNDIIENYQRAYITHRSTETAITLIINDILISIDNKASLYLTLLDLFNKFDIINHNILSLRLN